MLANRRAQRENESGAQLLKLYSNRAGVKRELNDLRKERHELLDKLKDQEGAILRARDTPSVPLRDSNRTSRCSGNSSRVRITNAAARVACPHRSTSATGVNQRIR